MYVCTYAKPLKPLTAVTNYYKTGASNKLESKEKIESRVALMSRKFRLSVGSLTVKIESNRRVILY